MADGPIRDGENFTVSGLLTVKSLNFQVMKFFKVPIVVNPGKGTAFEPVAAHLALQTYEFGVKMVFQPAGEHLGE